MSDDITGFRIDIPDADLDDLRQLPDGPVTPPG
jgi:hypothetical protein